MAEQRVTRKQVDAAIDLAETHFERCWRTLVAMKTAKISTQTRDSIHSFQPRLATTLFDLSRQYVALGKERQRRVDRKSAYSATWFKKRMAFLSKEQERLLGALRIGRSIGDAFAFFFYQNDVQFLAQHTQVEAVEVMSTGVGGRGELEAAKNMQMMGPYLVLHHCITSMLRVGDLSFIDLNAFKVAGLGEIKSHSQGPGQVTVSVSALCEGNIDDFMAAHPLARDASSEVPSVKLSPAAEDRLQRQMDRIQESHVSARKKPDKLINLRMENRMKVLAELLGQAKPGQMSCLRAGKGQVLFAYRPAKSTLSKRLRSAAARTSGRSNIRGMDELVETAAQLVLPERSDNAMLMNYFFYGRDGSFRYLQGMTHPFWWPLPVKLLRQVIFREVMAGSAYNPAILFSLLEEAGFEVDATEPFDPKVFRRVGDAMFTVAGMRFYLTAIQGYLMDEAAIVDALVAVYEVTMKDPDRLDKRISINLHQRFGEPPAVA